MQELCRFLIIISSSGDICILIKCSRTVPTGKIDLDIFLNECLKS